MPTTYTVTRRGLVARIVQVTEMQYVVYYCDWPVPGEPVAFDGRQYTASRCYLAAHMAQWRADGCSITEGWNN